MCKDYDEFLRVSGLTEQEIQIIMNDFQIIDTIHNRNWLELRNTEHTGLGVFAGKAIPQDTII